VPSSTVQGLRPDFRRMMCASSLVWECRTPSIRAHSQRWAADLSTRVYMRRMLGVHTMPASACSDAASRPWALASLMAAARCCTGTSPSLWYSAAMSSCTNTSHCVRGRFCGMLKVSAEQLGIRKAVQQ
jgi:hypothetical protein